MLEQTLVMNASCIVSSDFQHINTQNQNSNNIRYRALCMNIGKGLLNELMIV